MWEKDGDRYADDILMAMLEDEWRENIIVGI